VSSYRDDREADQARISSLEHELAQARAKVDALEGRQSQALVRASAGTLVAGKPSAVARWFGAPGSLQFARRFDGEFPIDQFEQLVERIREVTRDPGRTELLRSSLTWFASRGERSAGPHRVVTVTVRDGVTTLTVTERLGGLAGAIYGGVGGGVGGGGLSLPLLASIAMPALAPVFIVGWLGGVFLGTRAIFKHVANKRAVALQQLYEALVVDIEAAVARAPAK
jgi:hypothetical protein